jgi:hypothetical protein
MVLVQSNEGANLLGKSQMYSSFEGKEKYAIEARIILNF